MSDHLSEWEINPLPIVILEDNETDCCAHVRDAYEMTRFHVKYATK